MKKLYLIRHAKSDWSDASKDDFERGLNTRGGKAILTAQGLSKNIAYKGKLKYLDALYFAAPQEIIKEIKNKHDTVFIVGDNPETTELIDLMVDEYIDNVPTLGIVALNISVKQWRKFKPEKTTLDFFIYPKMFKS